MKLIGTDAHLCSGMVHDSKTGAGNPVAVSDLRYDLSRHGIGLRRVDRGLWLGTPDRRAPRPPYASGAPPGDERRELPPKAEQANQPASANRLALSSHIPQYFDSHTAASSGTVLLRPAGTISLRP